MKKKFLVVEDTKRKTRNILRFGSRYHNRLEFVTAGNPYEAAQVLNDEQSLAELSGVIADFSLGARRDDQADDRAVIGDSNLCGPQPYEIWTGLGVLDLARSRNPDLALWALTEVTAAHAPLFMGAAKLWLGAHGLSVGRFNKFGPLTDQLAEELTSGGRNDELNPIWDAVLDASLSLDDILGRPYNGVDSFDWISALVTVPKWMLMKEGGGLESALLKRIKEITAADGVKFYTTTFPREMYRWQCSLDDMYARFPIDRKYPWPTFSNEPKAFKAWRSFNPFTDYLAQSPECVEFFEAPDVRIAWQRWHQRRQQPQ